MTTRHAKAAFENGALGGPERGHAAVRPGKHLRTIICGENDDRIVGLTDILQMFQQVADAIIKLRHSRLFETIIARGIHHRLVLGWDVSEHVHARRVVPDEEGFAVSLCFIHEVGAGLHQHAIEGFHVVLGRRPLLPILYPAHVWKWR